jgi:DNA-binding transcriptional regulator of glucitol operon
VRAFLTPAWLLRHAVLLVAVAVCVALGWWQLDRARSGNMLSYAYAVEWPIFAIFAIGIWVREIRLAVRGDRPDTPPQAAPAAPADPMLTSVPLRARQTPDSDQDGDLSAYNDYLAWLAEDPSRRPADYRR